eukprot:Opistho-2@71761
MAAPKPRCLVVASGHTAGVSAISFVPAFTLASSAFQVQLATPNGLRIEFTNMDDSSAKWLADFQGKPQSQPMSLESLAASWTDSPTSTSGGVQPHKGSSPYAAILVVGGMGAVFDLSTNVPLAALFTVHVAEKKPICAIGMGVAALCGKASKASSWLFREYALTGPSIAEVCRLSVFPELPFVFEDFVRDNDAVYSASKPDAVHVVVDRTLITGQNDMSTLLSVQNLILMVTAKGAAKRTGPT